jgi:radical SAM protein with 4Fe4S-binding SPASM domain
LPHERTPELATNDFLDCIDQLALLGAETINFSGGEVLLRHDFFEIAERAHRHDIEVSFNTNATLLDDAAILRLIACDITGISVSVYGSTGEVHDAVTCHPGSFERTVGAIRRARNSGITVTMKSMIFNTNVDHLAELAELGQALGCEVVFDPHVLPRRDGSLQPLVLEVPNERLRSALHGRQRPTARLRRSDQAPICSAGDDRLAIHCNGDVYPCAVFPLRLGNFQEKSIARILDESDELAKFRRLTVKGISRCALCDRRSLCSICPGVGYTETGDYRCVSERACRIARCRPMM